MSRIFRAAGFTLAIVTAAALSAAGTAWSVRPRRWNAPIATMTRPEVHALLGAPEVDFSPKGWEGWDQPALIGAWVLIVYYGEGDRVTSVQSKFDWGFGYMSWDGRYRR
ncbi:hypothetical protein [Anaeromyxobacter sp. PSR-1]|uniref:hypothetical protein n=1 Tax=Anaeromyxobacter sp. PSR-1 TaxID=1300915 RepID=UPI001364DDFE|nr:hypothetical protein [Anaeromyxobacter sp. PSR-1]